MRLKNLTFLLPILAICATLTAEEKPVSVKEVTLVADAGKPWGEITVKLTTEKKKDTIVLSTVTITTAAGKQIEIPKEVLANLDLPQLQSVTITQDTDAKDGPWLYVHISYGTPILQLNTTTLTLTNGGASLPAPTPPPPVYPVATFAIGGTKLMHCKYLEQDLQGGKEKTWEAPAATPAK